MKSSGITLLLSYFAVGGNGVSTESPVQKVVTLLKEMQETAEKDLKADQEAYDKYNCWCVTNRGLKTEAVDVAEKRIEQLEAFLEEASGTEAQLKSEITAFEKSVEEDQEALRTATALREEESEAFRVSEADSKETLATLKEGLEILSKVQLLQHRKGGAARSEIRPLLLQVRSSLASIHDNHAFKDIMRRDLWDVMGAIESDASDNSDGSASNAGTEFLGRNRKMSALSRQAHLSVREEPPNALEGAAAGSSSYSARSSSIFGLLSEMKDEFTKNLIILQKQEFAALVSYQGLRAAKTDEINAAIKAKEGKESSLAETQSQAAQAQEDTQATKDALSEDEQFLVGLDKNCKQNDEDFESRMKMRQEELTAISQTITILTQDEARDLFGKTLSFLQTSSVNAGGAHQKKVDQAVKRIMTIAKKHKNWMLASLAVHVGLDAFTKVKEVMDKMIAELKVQQKEEVEKKDYCTKNLDVTEDDISEKTHFKEDLEGKHMGLENTIESLKMDVDALKKEIADMQIALKRAGEDRKAENLVFQQSVADQRGTITVLAKAKDRLMMFYNASLVQESNQEPNATEPGAAVQAPPPKPADYQKSGGGGGVIQLLEKIMQDASREEAALLKNEQSSQAAYEELTKDSNSAIASYQNAVIEKTQLLEQSAAEKSETEAALLSNDEELAHLTDTLKAYHLDCDWILKYFDTRQQARTEEIEAVQEAKAILSGADFGGTEE